MIEVQVDESLNPVLITAAELGRLLQISTRTVWQLLSKGEVPEPVRFAKTVRWRLEGIKRWIADDCSAPSGRSKGGHAL
jgi:predicted DNA-binding transcriptional regulator AlpA